MNAVLLSSIAVIMVAIGATAFNVFSNTDESFQTVPLMLGSSPDVEGNGVRDNVQIVVRDPSGDIIHEETIHNKIVTHGENCVAKMIFGMSGGDESGSSVCVGAINAGFRYIGIGEGTTAPVDGDTDLENTADESGLSTPILSTASWTNSTGSSFSTVLLSSTFTNAGSSETISEATLFNATDINTRGMYARVTFTPVEILNGGDITINWTFETGEATVP